MTGYKKDFKTSSENLMITSSCFLGRLISLDRTKVIQKEYRRRKHFLGLFLCWLNFVFLLNKVPSQESPRLVAPCLHNLVPSTIIIFQLSVLLFQAHFDFHLKFVRKLLPLFLVAVFEDMNMDLLSFLQKFVAYIGQLVKSFCTLYVC